MKKKSDKKVEEVEIEKINDGKNKNFSEEFYYIMGLVIGIVLIFATEKLLSTINYLFILIFALAAAIQIMMFIFRREYKYRIYNNLMGGIISLWLAVFIYKYGEFLFLEMLPVMTSITLFVLGVSNLISYFDWKKTVSLIASLISFGLGIALVFIPKSVMYTLFKVVGVYIILLIIMDIIYYIKRRK